MTKNELELFTKISEALDRLNTVLEFPAIVEHKNFRVSHHSKGLDSVEMDYTPTRLSSKPIKTQAQALEDILYRSGQMARDSWEALKGFEYDNDVSDNEDAAFRDSEICEEFEQSSLASYFSPQKQHALTASGNGGNVPPPGSGNVATSDAPAPADPPETNAGTSRKSEQELRDGGSDRAIVGVGRGE
ncbi:hypothetical protein [Peromfec virus RodF8_37]|uniref:Uncharacterized protein n=1 Tax=Peromfec virus RodF8_37 TaxID=2929372 RepID=A0A976N226_9VIRU|nr:hypothetical protein [Peromfec virus RodF8_37]